MAASAALSGSEVLLREGRVGFMLELVRVDDRLLHGQIICAWVPFIQADSLVVASDEAAKDALVSEIIESCGQDCVNVAVKSVEETVEFLSDPSSKERVILVLGDLKDAMRAYKAGLKFDSINLGNIHHEDKGRKLTPSVIVNSEDEAIMAAFKEMGVKIDIRDVPGSEPAAY